MKIIAVIPARIGSTRFPGKPTGPSFRVANDRTRLPTDRDVHGALDDIFAATCDQEIMAAVNTFGGKAIMTLNDKYITREED